MNRQRPSYLPGARLGVVTAHSAVALTLATIEALAVELPVALLCLWVAQRLGHSQLPTTARTASTNPKGALQ